MKELKITIHECPKDTLTGSLGLTEERVNEIEAKHKEISQSNTTITGILQDLAEYCENANEFAFAAMQIGANRVLRSMGPLAGLMGGGSGE